jgi:hypothetical protein
MAVTHEKSGHFAAKNLVPYLRCYLLIRIRVLLILFIMDIEEKVY